VLGLPVLTADYDFWVRIEDIATFNEAVAPFGLTPTRSPEEARAAGRYKLQNDEVVDVLVARSVPTIDGQRVVFEEIWSRRRSIELSPGLHAFLPTLDDLIATKRFASRPKDLEDVRLLEILRDAEKLP